MILSVKDNVKGIFLMTPYYMEPNGEDWMRKRMDTYGAICSELAEKIRLPLHRPAGRIQRLLPVPPFLLHRLGSNPSEPDRRYSDRTGISGKMRIRL